MTRHRSRGQSLVEFALVFPVFVLIVFGLIDGGRLIYTYNTLSNAARDAARVAIVNQSTTGSNTCDTTSSTAYPVGCAISSAIALGLTAGDVTIDYTDATGSNACGTPLVIGCIADVKVQAAFQPLTPIVGSLLGAITISSETKMPIENVYP